VKHIGFRWTVSIRCLRAYRWQGQMTLFPVLLLTRLSSEVPFRAYVTDIDARSSTARLGTSERWSRQQYDWPRRERERPAGAYHRRTEYGFAKSPGNRRRSAARHGVPALDPPQRRDTGARRGAHLAGDGRGVNGLCCRRFRERFPDASVQSNDYNNATGSTTLAAGPPMFGTGYGLAKITAPSRPPTDHRMAKVCVSTGAGTSAHGVLARRYSHT
jgi:hypothetical protein